MRFKVKFNKKNEVIKIWNKPNLARETYYNINFHLWKEFTAKKNKLKIM